MSQRNLLIVNATLILGALILLAVFWRVIPETLPMNMGPQSSPRAFMPKTMLFFPLGLMIFASFSVQALRNKSEYFSYPVPIHAGNKAIQEQIAKNMLGYTSVQISLMAVLIVLRAIFPGEQGTFNSLLIGLIACILIQVGVSVVRSRRAR